jgi:hypothetical protein
VTRQDEITRTADRLRDALGTAADVMAGTGIGLREDHYPERPALPPTPNPLARVRPGWRLAWRLGVAASAAAALVAGIIVALQPSAPAALTVQLLADRASAAALAQPTVSPGQWVYRKTETDSVFPHAKKTFQGTRIGETWATADGTAYYAGSHGGSGIDTYVGLASLPRNPAALDAYLERGAAANADASHKTGTAFVAIDNLLSSYVPPPALEAELYQALAILPGLQVDSHVTTIDGRVGVAFVFPQTSWSVEQEIILNPSTFAYLGEADWDAAQGSGMESALLQREYVAGPGSTQPSLTPPTAAELLAEQAYAAANASWPVDDWPLTPLPGSWILRKLVTSSGDVTIWATADDLEQASYVNGTLQVCSRSAACAASTQWLMPAGPSYAVMSPPDSPSPLPKALPQLLATLNSYSTGCTDVAGDCNAVNAIANMVTGYVTSPSAPGNWYLLLAEIPGVTVQHVTDVTGQADVALRFPFSDGVTQILFNASTDKLVGYVRNGTETVITKIAQVTGPGSVTTTCTPNTPGCAAK